MTAPGSDLLARARAAAEGTLVPAEPRHAATVVLLRDAVDERGRAGGVEVYLLRRVRAMAFAAGMHVFPGGAVDPEDAGADVPWAGDPADYWAHRLTADAPLARALVCAAVRETFEECGVLLAGTATDDVVDVGSDDWEADRAALEARELSLSALVQRRGLVVRADLLRAWSHWVTPEVEPRRFDTRFFVAALPPGQVPRHVPGESDRALWVRPRDALDRHAAGDLAMMPPTAFTLAELDEHDSVARVLAAAAGRTIAPVLPRMVPVGEHVRILLPGDPGYDDPPEAQKPRLDPTRR